MDPSRIGDRGAASRYAASRGADRSSAANRCAANPISAAPHVAADGFPAATDRRSVEAFLFASSPTPGSHAFGDRLIDRRRAARGRYWLDRTLLEREASGE